MKPISYSLRPAVSQLVMNVTCQGELETSERVAHMLEHHQRSILKFATLSWIVVDLQQLRPQNARVVHIALSDLL
jgi:hypothetical protein